MAYYPISSDISFEPLAPEAEAALFKTINANSYGSTRARNIIIRHYLKFVAKVALVCAKGVISEEDAISSGNLGLMQALKTRRYDPKRGGRFCSYLRKFVRGQVLDTMVKSQRVGCGALGAWRMEYPTDAALTGHIERKAGDLRGYSIQETSVVDESAEMEHLNRVRRDALLFAFRGLTPAERKVMTLELSGLTQSATASKVGVKRQAVGNLRKKALTKLRRALSAQKHDLL